MTFTGVKHSVLRQVGELFLGGRSGAGATGAKAHYRGGKACASLVDLGGVCGRASWNLKVAFLLFG